MSETQVTPGAGPQTPAPPAQTTHGGTSFWRRGNVVTALVLGVIGFAIGWWLGDRIGSHLDYIDDMGQNDVAILLGFTGATVGWLGGLGFLTYPFNAALGRPATAGDDRHAGGPLRYLCMCTDHKVIGLQYLAGIGVFFFIGGVNAMLIRTELLSASAPVFSPGQYLTIVTLHGTMMIMMTSSIIVGPLGHYLVPLMIGSRRMAFPRLESLSFWLLPLAGVILMTSIDFGGIPTGWTGYPSLATVANAGMDAYIFSFGLIAVAMVLNGLNLVTTIMNMRAPGMTWRRLPIFVWSMLSTAVLMVLAPLVLVSALLMEALDRTASTSFYTAAHGGSPFLFENLFWFFGHPEVYILALPGFGIVLEILPVFSRKPLWGYRVAVAGLLGVTLLSFTVWQHHLFVSGINSSLRPFYMLSTELISVPTGLIFLVAMGTLWRARIRFSVPMLWALAFLFNFLIGGLSGVYLSDVPSDVTLHGSYFVMAHFHYTIVGGLVFAFFGGLYYWLPTMTGIELDETLAKIHFWGSFIFFNSTFLPLFAVGALDMPRRVSTYAPHLQPLNDWVSISAFLLFAAMLVFLANLVYSLAIARKPAVANPWQSRGLEFQLGSPVPEHDFDRIPTIQAGPYDYGQSAAPAVARNGGSAASIEAAPAVGESGPAADRNLATGTRLWVAAEAFMFLAFLFAFFYLRTINSNGQWHPSGQSPSTTLGVVTLVAIIVGSLAYAASRRVGSATSPAMWIAFLAGCVAVIVQAWQLVNPGFSPSHAGGYGSVFIGFTAMYLIQLVATTFWLDTVINRARRSGNTGADEDRMLASADERHASFGVVWHATAVFYVFAFVLFYLL